MGVLIFFSKLDSHAPGDGEYQCHRKRLAKFMC
jgi:hypothetical protein